MAKCPGNGECIEQCPRCRCVTEIHFEDGLEIHRFDKKISDSVDCDCYEKIPRDRHGVLLDVEKYIGIIMDEICICGHSDHGPHCPSLCCSPVPCPICQHPAPAWLFYHSGGICSAPCGQIRKILDKIPGEVRRKMLENFIGWYQEND